MVLQKYQKTCWNWPQEAEFRCYTIHYALVKDMGKWQLIMNVHICFNTYPGLPPTCPAHRIIMISCMTVQWCIKSSGFFKVSPCSQPAAPKNAKRYEFQILLHFLRFASSSIFHFAPYVLTWVVCRKFGYCTSKSQYLVRFLPLFLLALGHVGGGIFFMCATVKLAG